MEKRILAIISILLFVLILIAKPVKAEKVSEKVYYSPEVSEILRARFGSGDGEIGVKMPSEANPEGPMSFALGKDEEIYILDQINSRIQVFRGGKKIRTISISIKEGIEFKDIALSPVNRIILLGRFYAKGNEKTSIFIIDSSGKVINVIPLEDRRLIPDSGEVTEILVVIEGKLKGIWVVLDYRSVRVASLDGKYVERISVPGKLSFNGKRLFKAEKIGDVTAVIYCTEEDSLSKWEPERIVHFEIPLANLLGIWDDQKGKIYLGAFLEEVNEKGKRKLSNEIVILSSDFLESGRVKLLISDAPHEIWRSILISPEGNIYQMGVDRRGVFIKRYKF